MLLAEPRHAAPASPDESRGASRLEGIPAWFAWAATVFVGVPSFGMLAFFQHALFATAWPFVPGILTASLAVGIDSFGITAGAYWLRSPRGSELRRWGFWFAVAAVLGSTGLMVASIHELSPGREWLGGIPALIVFGSTKLFTAWQADRAARRVVARDHAAELAAVELRAVTAERETARVTAERDEILSRLAALEARDAGRDDRDAATDTGPIPAVQRTKSAPGSSVTHIASGGSMKDRGKRFVPKFAAEHGRLPSGPEIDAEIGAKPGYGKKMLQEMRRAGELPELSEGDGSAAATA